MNVVVMNIFQGYDGAGRGTAIATTTGEKGYSNLSVLQGYLVT